MSFSVDPIWLLTVLLVFVRAAAWLVMVPPFGTSKVVPSSALVGVAAGLAILGESHVPRSAVPTDTAGLIAALLVQVFTGVVLGLSIRILLSAAASAGAMIDLFGGINLPPSIDPLSENSTPIFGQLYEQVAIVLLFVTNGELLLVKGFILSFGSHGISLGASGLMANIFTSDVATFFVATLEIAAPLVAVLFAAQVGLALLSKAAPQLNVFALSFPIQATLSLVFVAIGIRVLPGYLDNIVSRAAQDMTALMAGH